MAFVSLIHILLAVVVIILVLIQDPKGGGLGAFGGGSSSSSLLGPTGASSFLAKATRWVVIGFALTSILLTNLTSNKSDSALDKVAVPEAAAPSVPANPVAPGNPAATESAPAAAPTQTK